MFRGVGLWTSDLSPVLRAGTLRTAGGETVGGEENENERIQTGVGHDGNPGDRAECVTPGL